MSAGWPVSLRRPGLGGDLRGLPGHGRVTRHQPRSGRSRSRALFRHVPFGARSPSPGRVSGRDPHGRAVPGGRDLRLAAFPGRSLVHVLHRSRALRETPPARASIAATSPTPATVTSAPSSSKPPGPIGTVPTSAPGSPRATKDSPPRSWPAPGTRKCDSRNGSATRRPQERPLGRRRRDRTRARRVPVGRDDRRRHRQQLTMNRLEHPAIGAELLEAIPTRRDTAAAEPIPAGNPTTANTSGTAAQILGHPPAYRSIAISTREHHCGGHPIHDVPARRQPQTNDPPPQLLRGNA